MNTHMYSRTLCGKGEKKKGRYAGGHTPGCTCKPQLKRKKMENHALKPSQTVYMAFRPEQDDRHGCKSHGRVPALHSIVEIERDD